MDSSADVPSRQRLNLSSNLFPLRKKHNEQYHSGLWSKIQRLPVDLDPWWVHVMFHMFFNYEPHFSSSIVLGLD